MNAVDSMLDGDEPIVMQIAAVSGPLVAEQFVHEFNNACMQMAGFEDAMANLNGDPRCFLVPMSSYSRTEH